MFVRLALLLAVLVAPAYSARHIRPSKAHFVGGNGIENDLAPAGPEVQSDQQAIVNVYTDESCINTKAQPITVPGPFAARCFTPEGGSLSWIFTCSVDPDTDILSFQFSHWSTRGCTGNPISQMSFNGPLQDDDNSQAINQSGCGLMSVVSGGMPYQQYAKVQCELGSAAKPITMVRIEDEVPKADVEDIELVADMIDDIAQ